jgi:hypothetical protein
MTATLAGRYRISGGPGSWRSAPGGRRASWRAPPNSIGRFPTTDWATVRCAISRTIPASPSPRVAELARYDQVKTLFQYIGDVWEENYDGRRFQPTLPSLMDLPDTVAAENLADYHLHVYAYLISGPS